MLGFGVRGKENISSRALLNQRFEDLAQYNTTYMEHLKSCVHRGTRDLPNTIALGIRLIVQ